MSNIPFERTRTTRALCLCAGSITLRLASLLVGTGLFIEATPAWAVDECGPPPPGGGTVTCPPGEYPDGIIYFPPNDLEVVLQPGVVSNGVAAVLSNNDIRFIGPVDTLLNSDALGHALMLRTDSGTVFANVDDVIGNDSTRPAVLIQGSGSVTLFADTVVGIRGVEVDEGFPGGTPGSPGTHVRINSVTTTGGFAAAVDTSSIYGDVRTEVGSVTTSGAGAWGINSVGGLFSRTVFIEAGTVTTTGDFATAVRAFGLDLDLRTGAISTSGREASGIETFTSLGGTTIVSGSIATRGGGAAGIRARSELGDIDITSGSISTTGNVPGGFGQAPGIAATTVEGDVKIRSGSVSTTGPQSDGILASSSGGGVAVTSETVSTTGNNSSAIRLTSASGDIRLVSGTTTTAGSFSTAIAATTGSGNVNVESDSVTTSGDFAAGILAQSETGSVTVSVRNVDAAGPGADGILVGAGTASTITIRGLATSSSGYAIRAMRAPATLNIAVGATLRGRVFLTGNSDRVNNSGTFDATGNSDFGDGNDIFNNDAGGVLLATHGDVVLAGLDAFMNRGTIEMRDNATDDRLTISDLYSPFPFPEPAIGAYHGAGAARLGVDVNLTTRTADLLRTGPATGSTLVDVRTSGTASFDPVGIRLVDAAEGTSPTAFILSSASEGPYLKNGLRFDAASDDFFLIQTPGAAVFETARFGAMANRLWYESADAVAAQLDTIRDGRGGRGIGLWLQAWTAEDESRGTQSFGGESFDVSFEQDFQGLQGGVDFQAGEVVVGITGGAGRSDAAFVASGNPVEMEVRNIGAYLQGRAGPLFFSALAKRDWAELEIAPGAGLGAAFDADSFGVQANAGLRLGFGNVFAEPSVGLSWVRSEIEAFTSGPATIGPGEGESLRARAGLRVGAKLPMGGGALLPFVAVNAYEELGGRNRSDFTLGETLRLFDDPPGTRGQAAAGVSFVAAGFEAFVRADRDFSGASHSKAVRAGARIRF